jgi:hypothetical protein
MNELLHYAADLAEFDVFWWRDQFNGRLRSYPHDVVVVDYDQYSACSARPSAVPAKWAAKRRCDSASMPSKPPRKSWSMRWSLRPIAKESWKLAGYHYPGHTELFAQRTNSPAVCDDVHRRAASRSCWRRCICP